MRRSERPGRGGRELPGGGKPWFERRGTATHCSLKPVALEGHLLTAFYAAVVTGISLFFARGDLEVLSVVAWVALILAASLLYVITALRMSARAPHSDKGKAGCS